MRVWLGIAMLWSSCAAAEVYRWTDAQGQVHFGERPPAGAQRVEVRPQVIEGDADGRERAARWFDARREERDAARQQASQRRGERERECQGLERRLAALSQGGRYFSQDATGERHYYSDAQIEAARKALSDQMNGSCR